MGLFDKIKDNAKNISVRALEEEGDFDVNVQNAGSTYAPTEQTEELAAEPSYQDETPQEIVNEVVEEIVEEDQAEEAPAPDEKPEKEEKSKAKPAEEKPKEVKKEAKPAAKPSKPEVSKLNGKPYTPSYKQDGKKSGAKGPRVIDIAPQRAQQDSDKRVVYERERAIMATLASQRRLDGTSPLYVTSHLRFKTRVFINRIEYSGSFGKNVIPIENVGWVKLRAGGTGVIIESVEGKRIVMVIKPADRLAFADAIMKVQAMQPKKVKFKDTRTVRLDQLEQMEEGVDEIEKLARLLDKGILTQEEFDAKKKQILGI